MGRAGACPAGWGWGCGLGVGAHLCLHTPANFNHTLVTTPGPQRCTCTCTQRATASPPYVSVLSSIITHKLCTRRTPDAVEAEAAHEPSEAPHTLNNDSREHICQPPPARRGLSRHSISLCPATGSSAARGRHRASSCLIRSALRRTDCRTQHAGLDSRCRS